MGSQKERHFFQRFHKHESSISHSVAFHCQFLVTTERLENAPLEVEEGAASCVLIDCRRVVFGRIASGRTVQLISHIFKLRRGSSMLASPLLQAYTAKLYLTCSAASRIQEVAKALLALIPS